MQGTSQGVAVYYRLVPEPFLGKSVTCVSCSQHVRSYASGAAAVTVPYLIQLFLECTSTCKQS